jgi:hypothetical protein
VREAQEIVELALKGMLRRVGIDPPKWHDVGFIFLEYAELFPAAVVPFLPELNRISKWLRRERELAFFGDIDFIPSEEYTRDHALQAGEEARYVVTAARSTV